MKAVNPKTPKALRKNILIYSELGDGGLDLIINYDVKYRMGAELESEDE